MSSGLSVRPCEAAGFSRSRGRSGLDRPAVRGQLSAGRGDCAGGAQRSGLCTARLAHASLPPPRALGPCAVALAPQAAGLAERTAEM